MHCYPLEAQEPRRVPGGGAQRTVTVNEFPISTTMAGSIIELQRGALRELHWHANADEWQYYISGTAEMGVFLAQGNAIIDQFEAGYVGYAPMGAGHYIKKYQEYRQRVVPHPSLSLVGFNSPHYQTMDLSEWIAGNPPDVLAINFGISPEVVAELPHQAVFVAPPVSRK